MKINLDFIYPIGSLYLTTSIVSPSVLFGGTWTQIKDDAYLKIVSSGAGSLGGTSSNHKIPESAMPDHSHVVKGSGYADTQDITLGDSTWGWDYGTIQKLGGNAKAGTHVIAANNASRWGKSAYYPYYYGIYVWKRIA